jgi:hypothetical protein
MTNDYIKELSREEALALNGGGCAVLGALVVAAFLVQNWVAVAGGIVASYHYGCFSGA